MFVAVAVGSIQGKSRFIKAESGILISDKNSVKK